MRITNHPSKVWLSKIKPLRFCLSAILCLALSACQSFPEAHIERTDLEPLLDNTLFPDADAYSVESPESLFYLSDEAKAFVDEAIDNRDNQEQQTHALMRHILDRSELNLLYRADANTNATDTFETRAANCLSLTIMTYAMSRYAGFNASFQQVHIPEFWTRRDGYTLINGHINIRIRPKKRQQASLSFLLRDLVVDFDPQEGRRYFRTQDVDKARIAAMFYSNKSAEFILQGDLNRAYAYLRAALKQDPQFTGAWLNLGLVYRQAGDYALAEKAYLSAIDIDDDYLTAWENLAALYRLSDRDGKAKAITMRLEQKRKSNPFYHMMLAQIALEQARFKDSIAHYKQAIALDGEPHEFYFGLAQVYFTQGDLQQTERYLSLAKRKAGGTRASENYGEKMSMLASIQNLKASL